MNLYYRLNSTFLVRLLHIHTLTSKALQISFSPPSLFEPLLWIKFSSSMTEPTGSFSVVHFWSHYSDQRRMELSSSYHLWCVFVSCCLKMPEPLCRQIHFFFLPLWSKPGTSVVRSVRVGDCGERGVFELPLPFCNELGKDKGNVDRDNSTVVKVLWRQMWENTGFKWLHVGNESMVTHGVNTKFISLNIKGNTSFLINTSTLIKFCCNVVSSQSNEKVTQRQIGWIKYIIVLRGLAFLLGATTTDRHT